MKQCKVCKITKDLFEFPNHRNMADGVLSTCRKCKSEYLKHYRALNLEKCKQQVRELYAKNRKKYAKKQRAKPDFYVKKYLKAKNNILEHLATRLRIRLHSALRRKNLKKQTSLSTYLGCTVEELKIHLEKQFKPGMSWDNRKEWHIDHIVPLASAKDEETMNKLCHYTNLQPLWAEENLSKGARLG